MLWLCLFAIFSLLSPLFSLHIVVAYFSLAPLSSSTALFLLTSSFAFCFRLMFTFMHGIEYVLVIIETAFFQFLLSFFSYVLDIVPNRVCTTNDNWATVCFSYAFFHRRNRKQKKNAFIFNERKKWKKVI